jgi:hypothetical protein
MLFAPKGPLRTVNWTLTWPLASAVTPCMPVRSQSPGPVAVPLSAHSVTTSDSPGVKPVAWTSTVWVDASPVAGVTVSRCPPPAGPDGVGDAEAGAEAETGGVAEDAETGGPLLVSGSEPVEHPAASAAAAPAAARYRRKAEFVTCPCLPARARSR